MLDIDDAILAEVVIAPGKLSLGETTRRPARHTLTLTSTGSQDVTYTTSFVDAVATADDPDNPGFYLGESSVRMPGSVTVPAGGTAKVTVSIAADTELELAQYGGHLVFTPEEGDPLRVPYAGFAGDYQALPLLGDLPGLELPVLASLVECGRLIGTDCVAGGSWDIAEAGQVYTMRDGDFPTVIMHLEHPAQSITFEVYRVLPGKRERVLPRGAVAYHEEFVGRDSGGFSVRTWDGTRVKPNGKGRIAVPNGRYVLEVTVLNALGNVRNPDHVETWTTPVFTIDRRTS
ncbi:Fn3-like domain-containing protein [Actinotalea sp. K2]|nr:Fn3-like domain-containing protein [Actinotalea sp. K2]